MWLHVPVHGIVGHVELQGEIRVRGRRMGGTGIETDCCKPTLWNILWETTKALKSLLFEGLSGGVADLSR